MKQTCRFCGWANGHLALQCEDHLASAEQALADALNEISRLKNVIELEIRSAEAKFKIYEEALREKQE